jgi:hypothetical protein
VNSVHELSAIVQILRVLTQLWRNHGSCDTLAGIDDKSVISRKPLVRFEHCDASPRVARSTTVASWKFTVGTLLPVLVADPSRAHALAGIGGL